MVVQRVMCGVSILQMVLALATLGMCSTQYYAADFTKTTIPHIAVYFLLQALPLFNLLACGILGIVSSCLNNNTSRAAHISLTTQTSISLIVLVWYFSYWVTQTPTGQERECSIKCLLSTVLSLISCIGYLIYELTNHLYTLAKGSEVSKGQQNEKNELQMP